MNAGVQHMVTGAKWFLHLRKMGPLKLVSDLIDQFQRVMILVVCAMKIMGSFVLVFLCWLVYIRKFHHLFLLPVPATSNNRAYRFGDLIFSFSAADLLRLDSSSTDEIDKLAINELFEVFSNIPLHDTIPLLSRV